MIEYYNDQIKSYERRVKIAQLAMTVAFNLLKFQNDSIKEKLEMKVEKFYKTDLEQADKARKKLIIEITKKQNKSTVASIENIEEMIAKNFFRWQIKLDSEKVSKLAFKLHNNPLEAFTSYSNEYLQSKKQIKKLNEQKEQYIAQEKENTENTSNNNSYQTQYHSSENISIREHTPYVAITDEESKQLVKDHVDKKMNQKYMDPFTDEEAKRIRVLYPEFAGKDGYHSVEMLEKGIKINNYASRDVIKSDQMMDMARLVYEIECRNLLFNDKNYDASDLYTQIDMSSSLKKYEKAYEKYQKYYNSLSDQQKANVREYISTHEDYVELFGNGIISPNGLKGKINDAIKIYIVKHSNSFYNEEGYNYSSKTRQATKHMSIEEIVELYHQVINEEKHSRYPRPNDERLGYLQQAFLVTILDKLEEYNPHRNKINMSEEEKNKYEEERNIKLMEICKDVLNEEPIFKYLAKLSDKYEEGKADILKETHDAKKKARDRVYNLSAVKKALAKASGKWQVYLILMEKEELTKAEQEELKGMFK